MLTFDPGTALYPGWAGLYSPPTKILGMKLGHPKLKCPPTFSCSMGMWSRNWARAANVQIFLYGFAFLEASGGHEVVLREVIPWEAIVQVHIYLASFSASPPPNLRGLGMRLVHIIPSTITAFQSRDPSNGTGSLQKVRLFFSALHPASCRLQYS